MTAPAHHDGVRARAADRLGELTSIGAGHAAGALATLLARPFEMRVPEVRLLEPGRTDAPLATALGGDERAWCGVLFDVEGGPGGALALFFSRASREALLGALLGRSADVAAHAESALREVGNIVASHALSAMGDLLGARVLPSTPRLETRAAPAAFASLVAERVGQHPALRIEVELCDRLAAVRALLVYVPDAAA